MAKIILTIFAVIGFMVLAPVGSVLAQSQGVQSGNQQGQQGVAQGVQTQSDTDQAQDKDATQNATGGSGGSATQDAICEGIGITGADCNSSDSTVPNLVKKIINVFSWIVGAIAVIMLIYAGFRYVTAGGDNNKVSAAKNTILYAVVGLIVVALSQVIVNFVLFSANQAASGGSSDSGQSQPTDTPKPKEP